MTIKQTDREQIFAYGEFGAEKFDEIEAQLKLLLSEVASVNYHGAQAVKFKTNCVNHSVDFATVTNNNMINMNIAVSEATTYIASALGGASITLAPPEGKVEAPSFSVDTTVETAEDGPLLELRSTVEATFTNIEACFTDNLDAFKNLGADGWIGPEYDAALGDVTAITTNALDQIGESRTIMASSITDQLAALGMGS